METQRRIQRVADKITKKYKLTPKENEVLFLILKGRDNTQICEELGIALKTVKNHVAAIMQKTYTLSRNEVQAIAIEMLSRNHIRKDVFRQKENSRNSAKLQAVNEKISTEDYGTKDLEKAQVERPFDKRGGNGE